MGVMPYCLPVPTALPPMEPSLDPVFSPPLRRPLPASARWSRRVFGGLLALSMAGVLAVVAVTVLGGVQRTRATQAQSFQAWVDWRQAHCRLEGRVESGSFVCDTGQRFPVHLKRGREVPQAPAGFVKP